MRHTNKSTKDKCPTKILTLLEESFVVNVNAIGIKLTTHPKMAKVVKTIAELSLSTHGCSSTGHMVELGAHTDCQAAAISRDRGTDSFWSI